MIRALLGACSLAVLSFAPAHANDSEAGLTAGGLVLRQNDQIEMRKEKLYLSQEQVLVDYVFFNHGTSDQKITVAFPMPPIIGWGADPGMAVNYPFTDNGQFADNFMDFRVQVDGTSISPELEQRAFLGDTEIGDRLKALDLPLAPVGKVVEDAVKALSQDVRDANADLFDETGAPKWELRSTYYWEQTFPAGAPLRVSHGYRPVLGHRLLSASELTRDNTALATYCPERDFLTGGRKMANAAGSETTTGIVMGTDLSYVLRTGANWRGPIGKFTLTVEKPDAKSLVSFCSENVRKMSATRFQVEVENFDPKSDLNVLWLSPVQAAD